MSCGLRVANQYIREASLVADEMVKRPASRDSVPIVACVRSGEMYDLGNESASTMPSETDGV